MRLEVGAEFFGGHLEGRSHLFKIGISSFRSDRDLLMKYTGYQCLSSLNKVALTETSDTSQ